MTLWLCLLGRLAAHEYSVAQKERAPKPFTVQVLPSTLSSHDRLVSLVAYYSCRLHQGIFTSVTSPVEALNLILTMPQSHCPVHHIVGRDWQGCLYPATTLPTLPRCPLGPLGLFGINTPATSFFNFEPFALYADFTDLVDGTNLRYLG